MARPTGKSWVERELRTPKYRSRVEVDEKKEQKSQVISMDELAELEDLATCKHGYLTGCPYCK